MARMRIRRDERRRLSIALQTSLSIHAVLLSLTFGDAGLGVPKLRFPWQERRVAVPELHVRIVPPRPKDEGQAAAPIAEPLPQASSEQDRAVRPSVPSVPRQRATDGIGHEARPAAQAAPDADDALVADAKAPAIADPVEEPAAASTSEPDVMAVDRSDEPTFVVPPAPPEPIVEAARLEAERQEAARQAADREEAARQDAARQESARAEAARLETERHEAARQSAVREEAARQDAARQDAARAEAARLEAEREEGARQAAVREEAARQEAARQDAARAEAARLEAERQEAARLAAAREEAARQESARQESARQESTRQESTRQESARQDAARQEAARAEAARVEAERQEAARQAAAREEAARQEASRQVAPKQEAARARAEDDEAREARRRALGRQLDEEAARREAASTPMPPSDGRPYSLSNRRRARLLGRTDPNAALVQYAEAWARKVQFNMTFDMVREAAKRPHVSPVVTVALRRDGSVESITFLVSSGEPEIDEAVRRIVESQTPYQPFPPALASEFDVIEIRRTWHFDTAVRLQ